MAQPGKTAIRVWVVLQIMGMVTVSVGYQSQKLPPRHNVIFLSIGIEDTFLQKYQKLYRRYFYNSFCHRSQSLWDKGDASPQYFGWRGCQ